jgi:phosphate transport system permease protein
MATLPCSPTTPTSPPGYRASRSSTAPGPAALVLIIFVMVLNLAARLIARLFAPKTSGR